MNAPWTILRTDVPGADLSMPIEHAMIDKRSDVILRHAHCADDETIIAAATDADVLTTNESRITRNVLSHLPKLRAVVRYGIGFDQVDLAAATDNGIVVVNVPGFCTLEIAQYVVMSVLMWNKRLIPFNTAIHQGQWPAIRLTASPAMGATAGQTLGILGFGNIGRETARLALAMGMRVITCSGHLTEADREAGAESVSRDELFRQSDFLTVHYALNDVTRHSVGAREFSLMKPSAVIINTARGAILDEKALIEALQTGAIAGAALDVLEMEPPAADNPLLTMENVILTPHLSFYSARSNRVLAESVIQEALRCLEPGQRPIHVVNTDVIGRPHCRVEALRTQA